MDGCRGGGGLFTLKADTVDQGSHRECWGVMLQVDTAHVEGSDWGGGSYTGEVNTKV